MNAKRKAIWDKSGGKCWYCGCDLPERGWHADHFEPIWRQPPDTNYKWDEEGNRIKTETKRPPSHPERDTVDNLVPSCQSCNILKGASSLEGFRRMIAKFINSLNSYTNQYKIAKKFGLISETEQPVVFWFERQFETGGMME